MKKLITTFALSAVILSGLSVPTFAADLKNAGKPADSKTKAVQASILNDTILAAEKLKNSSSKMNSSEDLSSTNLLLRSRSNEEVYWTGTEPVSYGTSLSSNGHDLWSRGLKEGDNNYYWGYSYYYNSDRAHYSTATLNNGAIQRDRALAGETSSADTDSYQSPFAYRATAGLE